MPALHTDEENIREGIRKGDGDSFRRLFDQYYKSLTLFAFRYLDHMESARDAVQEVFVRIFENRDTIQIHTSLKSMLYTMVRNQCLNQIKHGKVREKHQLDVLSRGGGFDARGIEGEGYDADLEGQIDAAELNIRIHEMARELPEQCRRIYTMSRTENLSNQEIAARLQLSVRTVETQISKALKALREGLK